MKQDYIISIHALRGEGDSVAVSPSSKTSISIHALRGEGDVSAVIYRIINGISIHALRGEGDKYIVTDGPLDFDFNPRPPWGGRQKELEETRRMQEISIHALRGEGDFC